MMVMAAFPTWFVVWSALCCCLVFAADDALSFSVFRDEADAQTVNALSKLRRGLRAQLPNQLGKSLYWFGHFSVGDSPDLRLLVDTSSTDLLINPGVYKSSKNEKPYDSKYFTINYEGVNRAGFGFETINGTLHRDNVTAAGLSVAHQAIGNMTSYKYFDVPPLPFAVQGQGIIGFGAASHSSFKPPADSWFFNLCKTKAIPQCKLGLAFGTSGKGLMNIGKVAKDLIRGGLVALPQIGRNSYTVYGDVTIDNKIIILNQSLIMDVGTDNIQAPLEQTKKLFKILGIPPVIKTSPPTSFDPVEVEVMTGFFPCDKPPLLGFSFPTQSKLKKGEKARIFNVSPLVWDVYDHGHNNCTSILGGSNGLSDPHSTQKYWLLGQPFFAGHYINFDVDENTIGFGDLEDPSCA